WASPKVQPIMYANDANAADIQAFFAALAGSSYWSQIASEYGVGALTFLPPIKLAPAAATIDDSTLQSELAANTAGASPAWGVQKAGMISLFVFPEGTIVTAGNEAGCTDFDGYHDEVKPRGLVYAVSCACPGFDGSGITAVQQRTVDISHELIESATDPLLESNPAYFQNDDANLVWTAVTDGEVADMCEFNDDANIL